MTLTDKALNELFARAESSGLTLSKLAILSGITRVTLSNWRNRRALPTLESYLKVSAALDKAMA